MYRRQGWRCSAHRHPHSSVADSSRVNDAAATYALTRELPFNELGTEDAVPHMHRCRWDTTDPITSDVKLLHRRATTSSFDSIPSLPIFRKSTARARLGGAASLFIAAVWQSTVSTSIRIDTQIA